MLTCSGTQEDDVWTQVKYGFKQRRMVVLHAVQRPVRDQAIGGEDQ